VDHERPVILAVAQGGGTLVLRYGQNGEPVPPDLLPALTLHHDSILYYWQLQSWARAHGIQEKGLQTLPMLEPGTYTVCFDTQLALSRAGRILPGFESGCQSGFLPPGGELVLVVPVPGGDEATTRGAATTGSKTPGR
jgi:hypothetical protein